MTYKTLLLFGAPGSGKGTQGRMLGAIPGFYHLACGDLFRALDLRSEMGKTFLEYSSRGQLVPDELTIQLWSRQIATLVESGQFKAEIDFLVLDGIPRTVSQAAILKDRLDVRRLFHLACRDRQQLVERLKGRALKESRLDDVSDEVIAKRLQTYEEETRPLLDFYGEKVITHIEADQRPYQVLRDILGEIEPEKHPGA